MSYKPFLRYMIDNDIKKGHLHDKLELSWNTIAKLSKGEYVNLEIIERICVHYNLKIEEVVEIKKGPTD